ncbi:ABC transporter ATP-binding protein [Devosia salina]|uniref:ABC transporter ATP-binding protein n=1 Tax=Devosia salina TaxID=2860336 RepID=A0ABX8WHB4_9HYPH|nr:ABC transporter ATP-binding protein [Devosia salina]QYO77778.1 ABC transporter ATP-binding protein [Devosia salina]
MAEIKLDNISLEYPVVDAERSFRKALLSPLGGVIGQKKGARPHVRALNNINLTVRDGDRLGLVGHNGAGKTTLIKLLGGVLQPTTGTMSVSGSTATLVTQGLGVDAEDTGYENIKLCGLYLGMTPREIEAKTKEIAEFTELGDFLHLPVKTYSTGMVVRLSFAITTAVSPEIMIMDEGIGAGDARFAKKAQERFERMVDTSKIIVLASHSPSLIAQLCNKAILMSHGEIVQSGSVEEIQKAYDALNAAA